MSRKGQGISINMVIIAAIAVLVLIIAVVLVAKGGRNVDQQTGAKSCLAQGGTCKAQQVPGNDQGDGCGVGEEAIPDTNCAAPTQYCCRYAFGG